MGGVVTRMTNWIFIYFCLLQCVHARRILEEQKIYYLDSDDSIENHNPGLKTYCHKSTTRYLTHIWKTITMHLNINSDSYILYHGKTPSDIRQKHEENQRSWSFNLFDTRKHKQLKINPFEDTCIGVYMDPSSKYEYIMKMTEIRVNVWNLTLMLFGIIIFWCAQILSRNSLFYYGCGIVLGVTTSVIILLYITGKLLPRGKLIYLVFAGTMSLYLAQILWENAQLIAMQYKEWVMWYILVTSLISFLICYRFGPVTNKKTKQIIQWFLQFIGLIMVYNSSYFYEATISCCVVLILLYNFPRAAFERGKKYWQKVFPEKRKLLNKEQYRQEGIRETKKALKQLQEFCSSPECNTWKTVLRLENPIRFAKFMEGESHLSEDEVEKHDIETSKIIKKSIDDYTDEYTDDDYY